MRRGTLWPVHRGVYAAGTDRLTSQGHWLAAVLTCGDDAVLSHQSAAALWGIGPTIVSPVHVTVPGNRRSRPRTIADLPRDLRDDAAVKARVLRLLDDDGPRYRSNLERDVHRIITDLGLEPEVNSIVEGRERDLVFREQKVVVEVDGPHHHHPAQRAADRERDAQLAAAGWRIRRLRPA